MVCFDAARPGRCRFRQDEKSVRLLDHKTDPLPVAPGLPAREDYEYKRCGTVNMFVAFEPLTGRRTITVTERRGNAEFTEQMQALDLRYPGAEKIRVVLDNLSTHSPAAFYQHLTPKEARRLTQRFEWVYTPKHASWLNSAEIEWSVLERQCLGQRLASKEILERVVKAWEVERNARNVKVNWLFNTQQARVKLSSHYPQQQ